MDEIIKELQTELVTVTNERATVTNEKDSLSHQLSKSTSERTSLRTELKGTQQLNKDLNVIIESSVQELQTLKETSNNLISENEMLRAQKERTVKELRTKLQDTLHSFGRLSPFPLDAQGSNLSQSISTKEPAKMRENSEDTSTDDEERRSIRSRSRSRDEDEESQARPQTINPPKARNDDSDHITQQDPRKLREESESSLD